MSANWQMKYQRCLRLRRARLANSEDRWISPAVLAIIAHQRHRRHR